MKTTVELLSEANDVIRSMSYIIERKGAATNWGAIGEKVQGVLSDQHKAMYPDQYVISKEEQEADVQQLEEILSEKRKFLYRLNIPNRIVLYESVSQILKLGGFEKIKHAKDDEKWFSKDKIVVFNCPHYCGKFSFGEIIDDRFCENFIINIPTPLSVDIKEEDIDGFCSLIGNIISPTMHIHEPDEAQV